MPSIVLHCCFQQNFFTKRNQVSILSSNDLLLLYGDKVAKVLVDQNNHYPNDDFLLW